jgi:alpha-mannosidase
MYEHMNNTIVVKKFILVALFVQAFTCNAQKIDASWPVKASTFIQGFEQVVSGETLDFLPGLTNGQVALLVRAGTGKQSLEFKSAVVPAGYSEKYLSLVWSTAIAKRLQEPAGAFSVYINDKLYFTFYAHRDSLSSSWTLKSGEADLSFVSTEITKGSQDAFGFMFLNIPTTLVTKGERISIKVIGGNQNSMDWFMPFGIPVVNAQSFLAEPALVNTKTGLKQRIRVEIKHAAKPTSTQFKLDGKLVLQTALKPGKNVFHFMVDPVETTREAQLEIIIGGKSNVKAIALHPVRKFEVYFLSHSHVDIGFTHKQDDVEKLQWRNFEKAIELAEKTKDYPDGSRYKWNTEGTWAVEGYLKNASPEKKQQFIDAVKKGWIGIDALYGNELTGLQREEEMINNPRYALLLNETYGLDINSAMISDVPGYSWGMVESLAQNGIKYFSSGPNHMPHLPHGGYQVGHSMETWGDVPFYWASASGKQKILFWMTIHGYSWFHDWSIDILSKSDGHAVLNFLDELDQKKYPYDMVQLRYTVGNDNGPPDATMPDFIKQWNETYAYPKLRIATTKEMMEEFEKRYADKLPTYSGDLTPYWEDGAASSAVETGINRKTADQLVQAEALSAMVGVSADVLRFDEAWRNVVLFSEHTWGANISKSQPESEFTKSLWSVKQGFALNAEKESNSLLNEALQTWRSKTNPAEAFQVVNTTSWKRTNLVTLPASWNLSDIYITDDKGKNIASQQLTNGSWVFVASEIPALSSRKYFIKKGKQKSKATPAPSGNTISNGQINVTLDSKNGDITAINFKNGPNLVDPKDTLGFNAYWYGGVVKENLSKQTGATLKVVEHGNVLTRIQVVSSAPGAVSLTREIQLVNGLDEIYLTNIVDKKNIVENENVRFSFPFNLPNSQVRIDIPWATTKLDQDQLAGANKNFYSVQRWVDLSNENSGVTLAPIEAPMLEIGDMNGQKWMTDMAVRPWIKKYEPSNRLFSWVMNNVWFVNYKASQEGKIPFNYVLKPHGVYDEFATKKFGIEQTQPLLVVPVAKTTETIKPIVSIQEGTAIMITSLKQSRDGKALIIRFFNPTDQPATTSLSWKKVNPKSVYKSSPKEEKSEAINNTITLSPKEVQTIRVEL